MGKISRDSGLKLYTLRTLLFLGYPDTPCIQRERSVKDGVDKQRPGDNFLYLDHKLQSALNLVNVRLNGIDVRLDKVEDRLDGLDSKQEKMDDRLKRFELLHDNDILPRLQTMEACYLDMYHIFAAKAVTIDKMQIDIETLKSVVKQHAEMLEKIS